MSRSRIIRAKIGDCVVFRVAGDDKQHRGIVLGIEEPTATSWSAAQQLIVMSVRTRGWGLLGIVSVASAAVSSVARCRNIELQWAAQQLKHLGSRGNAGWLVALDSAMEKRTR